MTEEAYDPTRMYWVVSVEERSYIEFRDLWLGSFHVSGDNVERAKKALPFVHPESPIVVLCVHKIPTDAVGRCFTCHVDRAPLADLCELAFGRPVVKLRRETVDQVDRLRDAAREELRRRYHTTGLFETYATSES